MNPKSFSNVPARSQNEAEEARMQRTLEWKSHLTAQFEAQVGPVTNEERDLIQALSSLKTRLESLPIFRQQLLSTALTISLEELQA